MGRQLYLEYRSLCPMQVGDVHLIDASPSARQKKVLLACTMILPGTPIPVENVTETSQAILRLAKEHGITSLAWPLLGSGGGRIDGRKSYEAMIAEIEAFRKQGYDPEIYHRREVPTQGARHLRRACPLACEHSHLYKLASKYRRFPRRNSRVSRDHGVNTG